MAERGQASVELVAAVPGVLLAAVLCLQLLATGYSLTLADGAAEAGAIGAIVLMIAGADELTGSGGGLVVWLAILGASIFAIVRVWTESQRY